MPSPIGHAIAGAAVAWAVVPQGDNPAGSNGSLTAVAFVCAALAAAPDLDILFPGTHRTVTHSIGALAMVSIVVIAVTGKVTSIRGVAPRASVATALILAYASHLLLDWLAMDNTAPRGRQLLWPFSDAWQISEWDLFRGTARRNVFSAESIRINILAIAQEIAMLGPLAWIVWSVRVKPASGLSTRMSRGDHPAE